MMARVGGGGGGGFGAGRAEGSRGTISRARRGFERISNSTRLFLSRGEGNPPGVARAGSRKSIAPLYYAERTRDTVP